MLSYEADCPTSAEPQTTTKAQAIPNATPVASGDATAAAEPAPQVTREATAVAAAEAAGVVLGDATAVAAAEAAAGVVLGDATAVAAAEAAPSAFGVLPGLGPRRDTDCARPKVAAKQEGPGAGHLGRAAGDAAPKETDERQKRQDEEGGKKSRAKHMDAKPVLCETDAPNENQQSSSGLVSWSRHLRHEDPSFSVAFCALVAKVASHFDVEVFASRLNVYRHGKDWKPFHHDSHAYSKDHRTPEDFTIGVSLGSSRSLEFLHPPSGLRFCFPQANGDVFAFNTTVNRLFQHGVPQLRREEDAGVRLSVIAWGRRTKLTPRNSTAEERRSKQRQDHGPQTNADARGTTQETPGQPAALDRQQANAKAAVTVDFQLLVNAKLTQKQNRKPNKHTKQNN
eukprot:GHVT01007311.1.p1 GENE.GHVT01007311.1~~GHVT01007311.1.p1  ORF type:complete len:397 (+),score=94.24 GHVT01007311.1:690-1880(+)